MLITIYVQEEGRLNHNNTESAHTTLHPIMERKFRNRKKIDETNSQNGLNKGINKSSSYYFSEMQGSLQCILLV